MADESRCDAVAATMRRINQAWLDGHVEHLAPIVHPEMVMAFPGFAGRMQGREAFLGGAVISARTRKFTPSVRTIIKWMSRAVWRRLLFDMRWFTSVRANASGQPAGTCGYSRAKMSHGLLFGVQCLMWRRVPPNESAAKLAVSV